MLKLANLALLLLFPVSWFAPLLRAGIDLPLFGVSEISVISGLQSLWQSDVALALLVTFGMMRRKVLPALEILGKLAMADVFLIALYVVVVKGVGYARVDTAWGLYLFTGCVLASIAISHLSGRRRAQGLEVSGTSGG